MKYAITGHTRGIGCRAFERLDSLGFSKSTGYDITNKNDRQRIVNESMNCDVFINNAHSEFGSTYMLVDIVQAWKNNPEKKIINVGSKITELITPYEKLVFYRPELMEYHAEKLSLKSLHFQIAPIVKCQMSYRWFGYVGTKQILEKYPHFTSKDYITEDQAVDIIIS